MRKRKHQIDQHSSCLRAIFDDVPILIDSTMTVHQSNVSVIIRIAETCQETRLVSQNGAVTINHAGTTAAVEEALIGAEPFTEWVI